VLKHVIYPESIKISVEDIEIENPKCKYFNSIYQAQNYLIQRELEAIEKAKQNIKEIRELYDI